MVLLPCPAALTSVETKLEAGLVSDICNLWRWQSTFPSHRLMDDSSVIQLTALSSCKTGSCPTRTESSNITQRMNIQSAFTRTWARSTASVTSHLIFHLCLGLPNHIFHSVVNKDMSTFLPSIPFSWPIEDIIFNPPMHATSPANHFLSSFVAFTLFSVLHFIMQCSASSM